MVMALALLISLLARHLTQYASTIHLLSQSLRSVGDCADLTCPKQSTICRSPSGCLVRDEDSEGHLASGRSTMRVAPPISSLLTRIREVDHLANPEAGHCWIPFKMSQITLTVVILGSRPPQTRNVWHNWMKSMKAYRLKDVHSLDLLSSSCWVVHSPLHQVCLAKAG